MFSGVGAHYLVVSNTASMFETKMLKKKQFSRAIYF